MSGRILTGDAIDRAVKNGKISISYYDECNLNPNSYNIHTGYEVTLYKGIKTIDLKNPGKIETETFELDPEKGMVFRPGMLYLVPTMETIATDCYEPILTGRSSIGRYGISIHNEAGFGDIGFHGKLTMQIKVTYPTVFYPNIPIGQVYFLTPFGRITQLYQGKYQNATGAMPSRWTLD